MISEAELAQMKDIAKRSTLDGQSVLRLLREVEELRAALNVVRAAERVILKAGTPIPMELFDAFAATRAALGEEA